jgi:8-oxo-dGTP pyrophosphatase MutT (NUDIX family)
LRTHAGQTALPGGRVDEGDKTLAETAVGYVCLLDANRVMLNHIVIFLKLREAYEEVQLPLGSLDIHVLGAQEPFLSLHKLLVTPVFALLTRKDLLGELKPSEEEVSKIFSHPLEAVLDPQLSQHEANLAAFGSEDWPYETTYHVCSHTKFVFKVNSFLSFRTRVIPRLQCWATHHTECIDSERAPPRSKV